MRLALAGWLLTLFPTLAAAQPPPIERFTEFPRFEDLKVSPSGTHLGFVQQTSEFEAIAVLRMRDMALTAHTQFGRLIGIEDFIWANDSRLLLSPTRRFPGFIDFRTPTGEILGIDADGKKAQLLFGFGAGESQPGRIQRREPVYSAAEVIDPLPGDPGAVLIQTVGYGIEGEYNSVHNMDVRDGRVRKLVTSPVRNGSFLTDVDHRVALVSGRDSEGNHQVHYRDPDKNSWELKFSSALDEGSAWPVARADAPGSFYVLDDRDEPTRGVFLWTPATGERRLLFRHPVADLALAGVDPRGRAWGFRYVDHYPEYWYPDREHPLARAHLWLRQNFPGHDVSITSQTDDMRLLVAAVSGPRAPTVFFVVDVHEQALLHKLKSRPDLEAGDLAPVYPIEVTVRDGLKVRGYLTLSEATRGRQLPMVVMVHGGPHGVYDGYGFDPVAQLFASRGYAVLQVNYRGSGGRGRAFERAGFGKWGREMQDDVTDAVRWAVQDGVADPRRICIYGESYGAYAALTGAFREPDLFRCAIGMAGVYDLPLLFERGDIQTVRSGVNYLKLAVGTDEEELRRRSPVHNADKIRAPVLLLHGKLDERALFEHATRMRKALERAGNPPEWSTEWGEGHGFLDERNRKAAYGLILDFLGRHLRAGE